MDKFSTILKSTMEESWEKNIKATQFWNSAIKKTITVEHYAAFLRETYHYTKLSALIQSTAIPHFQRKNRDLVKPFLRHAQEEESHYKLCIKDLENLGYRGDDLLNSHPLPTTEGYVGFAINRIHFVNPLAYFGYLFNLEYMAIKLGPEFISVIKDHLKLEKHQLSFFMAHVEEDQRHVEELLNLIDSSIVTSEDQQEVLYAAKTASALYAIMVDAAFSNPWKKEALNVEA